MAIVEVTNAHVVDVWRKDYDYAGLVFEDGDTVIHMEMNCALFDELLDYMLAVYNRNSEEDCE